jgi:hypothetical protein
MRLPSLLVISTIIACSGGQSPPFPEPELPDCCTEQVGPVTLRIHGAHMDGVRVIFQDTFSSVLEDTHTDPAGLAVGPMKPNGFVTVIDPFGPRDDGRTDLRTFAGVGPFEELVLEGPQGVITNVTVTAAIEPGATSYELTTSCGAGSLAVEGGIATGQLALVDCGASVELLLITRDASDTARRSIFHTASAIDGATIALPNAYEPIPAVTLQYSGVEQHERIVARTTLARSRPVLEQTREIAIASGVGSATLPLPSIGGGTLLIESLPAPAEAGLTAHGMLDWAPTGATTYFLDMWRDLLPAVTSRPRFQVPNTIVWTEDHAFAQATQLESSVPPPMRGPDLVVVDLAIARADRSWTWTVAAPHQKGLLALPVLPPDTGLAPGDTVEVTDLFLAAVPFGYDAVRARVLSSRRPRDLIVDPFAGRIVYQQLR